MIGASSMPAPVAWFAENQPVLFLTAIAMIYGALGTVNMAQLADRMGELPDEVQLVLHLMLLLAFLLLVTYVPWVSLALPTWLNMS